KNLRHLCGGTDMAFGIQAQQASGSFEVAFVVESGEYIQNFPIFRGGVEYAVGSQERQLKFRSQLNRNLIALLLLGAEMALNLNIDILWSENRFELLQQTTGFFFAASPQCMGERAVFISSQANGAASELLQFRESCGCRSALSGPKLDGGNQPAKIFVARLGRRQYRQPTAFRQPNLSAYMGF